MAPACVSSDVAACVQGCRLCEHVPGSHALEVPIQAPHACPMKPCAAYGSVCLCPSDTTLDMERGLLPCLQAADARSSPAHTMVQPASSVHRCRLATG